MCVPPTRAISIIAVEKIYSKPYMSAERGSSTAQKTNRFCDSVILLAHVNIFIVPHCMTHNKMLNLQTIGTPEIGPDHP